MAGIGDIAKKAGIKYEDASKCIDAIKSLLEEGEKITIQDFGTFDTDVQDERVARNPQKGSQIEVPAKAIPKFKFNWTYKKHFAETVKVNGDKLAKKRARKEKILKAIADKAAGKAPAPAAKKPAAKGK